MSALQSLACIPYACTNPPIPPGQGIKPMASDGDLFTFGSSVNYTCESVDLFFEDNQDKTHFEVECMEGGFFDLPEEWPKCVDSKYSQNTVRLQHETESIVF